MTSDDSQFLDLLASIPSDVSAYGSRIAEYIEKHSSSLASEIRDAIDQATWLPDSLKPPRSSHYFAASAPPPPPQGLYEKTVAWISHNRTAIAVVLAFTGTTLFLVHRRKRAHARKRRARKLPNGAKREIVVLACSTFHDPLTRSLAVDLERRGYMVYVTVSSTEEDSLVQQEAKPDLRPLWIDVTSTVPNPNYDTHPDLEPIRDLLSSASRSRPVSPSSPRVSVGSRGYEMTLAGIVLFPGCSGYPVGPLALLHPTSVVDSINTRLLQPLLTLQQFLPLLARHSTDPMSPTSIVIAYPSIPQSLTPPAEVPSTITSTALSALAASLRREVAISSANIVVNELRLGNFDLGSTYSRTLNRDIFPEREQSQALTHWHSSQRAAAQRSRFGQSSLIRGSSAREFHNAVFDALAPPATFKAFGRWDWQFGKYSTTSYVGSGARVYDLCGKYLPSGLVTLMMGYRRRRDLCLLPASIQEKVVGDSIDDGYGIGRVPTYDVETGRPVEREPELNAANVWGGGESSHLSTQMGSDSAMWEKV